jgi:hypothetical protein
MYIKNILKLSILALFLTFNFYTNASAEVNGSTLIDGHLSCTNNGTEESVRGSNIEQCLWIFRHTHHY